LAVAVAVAAAAMRPPGTAAEAVVEVLEQEHLKLPAPHPQL